MTVNVIEPDELKRIYEHIKKDFPKNEYPPYKILYKQLKKGIQKGFVLLYDGNEVAYSICTQDKNSGFVLISLFAVYEEFRGKGIGSIFIEELKKIYSESSGIIVEVEKSETSQSIEEKAIREKRIAFYQRAGFNKIDNIDYSIWDVPMHLMVYSERFDKEYIKKHIDKIMYDIYLNLLGRLFIHKMKLKNF